METPMEMRACLIDVATSAAQQTPTPFLPFVLVVPFLQNKVRCWVEGKVQEECAHSDIEFEIQSRRI